MESFLLVLDFSRIHPKENKFGEPANGLALAKKGWIPDSVLLTLSSGQAVRSQAVLRTPERKRVTVGPWMPETCLGSICTM